MLGAGIQPIMMRSFVQFMLAEAVLYGVVTTATTGSTVSQHLQNGIQASMDDVRQFVTTGTLGNNGFSASPVEAISLTGYPTYAADVANYKAACVSATYFGSAVTQPDQMNYIAREYWIAAYGNGVETYNLYRRTGMPGGMQPTIIQTSGSNIFPRSYYYPDSFVQYVTQQR